VGSVLMVWNRAWLRLLWTLGSSTAFIILILIVDRVGMAPVIYENYYPVVGLIWAIAFATELERASGLMRRGGEVVFALACLLGLLQIHRGHYRLQDRVAYLQRITSYQQEHGSRKSLMRFDNYPWTYALVQWAVGMESSLASAVKGPEQASTIFVINDLPLLDSVAQRPQQFLGPDWQPLWFGLQSLDSAYFRFPQDVGYTWVNSVDSTQVPDQLRMSGPEVSYRMVPDRFTVIPIRLENVGDRRIASCTVRGTPLQFMYELLREDGTVYQESAIRTSLETDIAPGTTYMQGLLVERPVDKGRFIVRTWLTADGAPVSDPFQFGIVADSWPL